LKAAKGDETGEDYFNCLRFEYFHK
jgi:hypothetical protein